MSAREWKPGDVAMRVGLGERYVAVRVPRCGSSSSRLSDEPHWHFGTPSASTAQCGSDLIAEYRPLVVIDPEDREQVERLAAAYFSAHIGATFVPSERASHAQLVVNMQAALRSLIEPPKCSAALTFSGEHFRCDQPEGHGSVHTNVAASAAWDNE